MSSERWHEATGAKRDGVLADLVERREQALSADSGTAALGFELDEDGDILWWVSPAFLHGMGPWATKPAAAPRVGHSHKET
jgi:hypothetical protein